MKLSEAIRIGNNKFPVQAIGQPFDVVLHDGKYVKAACALGCAVYGVFECEEGFMVDVLGEMFPELDGDPIADGAPVINFEYGGALKGQIECLNDYFDWSCADIANWLERHGL